MILQKELCVFGSDFIVSDSEGPLLNFEIAPGVVHRLAHPLCLVIVDLIGDPFGGIAYTPNKFIARTTATRWVLLCRQADVGPNHGMRCAAVRHNWTGFIR